MKTIIISDTHIGSKFSKTTDLINFLKQEHYDRLILAGDIIDFIKVPNFDKLSLDFIDSIDFTKEIIYIVGNHDISFTDWIGQKAFGIKFCDNYAFEDGGRKFLIQHGHEFDTNFLVNNKFVMSLISICQNFLEGVFNTNLSTMYSDWKNQNRDLKKIIGLLENNSEYDVFISGHFHNPEIFSILVKEHTKHYIDCGDWVTHSTYIEIIDGNFQLIDWSKCDKRSITDKRMAE